MIGPHDVVERAPLVWQVVATKGQILVPRQECPLARPLCIAIDVVILVPPATVAHQGRGRQVVDHRRDVQVIEQVGCPLLAGQLDTIDGRLQVAVILIQARHLGQALGRRIERVETDLVQRPTRIQPLPF